MLDCADPADPGTRWWELPGGGVEPGETEVQALVREVREETGLRIEPADIGPLQWTQDSTFTHNGTRRFARCHGYVVAVTDTAAARPKLMPDETDTILGQRWWTVQEIATHDGRFFPSTLPKLLPQVLGRVRVDDPYDNWN